jgi:putative MFS transporter
METSALPEASVLAARLDRLPASRAVWTIICLISLGGVFEFYDLFFTAYVAPGMVKSGLFTAQSLGVLARLKVLQVAGPGTFVFATFIGLWLGAVAFGHLPDRFGRKAAFTWSLVWYALCTAVMAFQHSGEWLNFWRFSAGIGFGIQLVTIDTYLAELTPAALRGRAFSINQTICFAIVPVLALLAWRLVPLRPLGVDGWRWIVLFGSVGAAAVWALRPFIPESPRWLLARGRLREAEAIIRQWEDQAMAEQGRLPPVSSPAPAPQENGRLVEIFSTQYRGRTAMLSIFNIAQAIGFYGFNAFVPALLIARGITITHSLEYAFLIAIAQPFGPLLGTQLADRVERRAQIIAGLACMGLAMLGFARASSPALLIALGIVFTLAANIMSYAFHGYQAELFPTRIRARAVGFVYSWSRLAAAFGGLIIGALLGLGGSGAVAGFIAGAMLLGILVIWRFGPRSVGLELEQISR